MPLANGLDELSLQALAEEGRIRLQLLEKVPMIGHIGIWELQSRLATIVCLTLIATGRVWETLVIMTVWSFLAAVFYSFARENNLMPDLYEHTLPKLQKDKRKIIGWGATTLIKCFVAGVQDSIYVKSVERTLQTPTLSFRQKLVKRIILLFGMVYFGVTANHHLQSKAGFRGLALVGTVISGSFLNVSFRTIVGVSVLSILPSPL